ncbi:MAG TPA: twin-arginine translocase TatA/TatE family subunit [Pyrinomonadaceae bacterium]
MFLLILESLGSTELVFILIMALVFFGPRKLPQISRSLGKNLAEFRRASEDFKRTWDREVSLEDVNRAPLSPTPANADLKNAVQSFPSPSIAAITPDQVVARSAVADPSAVAGPIQIASDTSDSNNEPRHSPRSDWF